MARMPLNKSSLHEQRRRLRVYERFLPSLDLKRRQLIAEAALARAALVRLRAEAASLAASTPAQLPMLANESVDVSGLVRVEAVRLGEQNLLGVKLPVLHEIVCVVRKYSLLAKPHWVDLLVTQLRSVAELEIRARVGAERVKRLEREILRTTQRVNLFEKVLVPTTRQRIRSIEIFLADANRAEIVRSKIAKARYRRVSAAGLGGHGEP